MILREINRSDKKPTDLKAKNSLPGVIIICILVSFRCLTSFQLAVIRNHITLREN